MADGFLATGQRRARQGVVEVPREFGRRDQLLIRPFVVCKVRGDPALHVGEPLAALLVEPQEPWSASETGQFERAQDRMRELGVWPCWPPHLVADAHDAARSATTG